MSVRSKIITWKLCKMGMQLALYILHMTSYIISGVKPSFLPSFLLSSLPPTVPPILPLPPTLKDEVPTIQSPDFSSCHKVE